MADERNIVFRTHDQVEASVMQSVLEANGITVFRYGESISTMYGIFSPTIGGITLGVPAEQVGEAEDIIREYGERQKGGPAENG